MTGACCGCLQSLQKDFSCFLVQRVSSNYIVIDLIRRILVDVRFDGMRAYASSHHLPFGGESNVTSFWFFLGDSSDYCCRGTLRLSALYGQYLKGTFGYMDYDLSSISIGFEMSLNYSLFLVCSLSKI